MRLPAFLRRKIKKHRKVLEPTARPVVAGSLEHAQRRLKHQIKQAEKWEGRFKFGQHNGMSRQELKVKSEGIRAGVAPWEKEVARLEAKQ